MSEPFDFEGETDMELLGGTFEDEPAPAELDAEPEEPKEEPKAEPKAEDESKEAPTPDDDEPEEPQPKRDTVIPRARFDEVNAKLHAEREEAARLRAELEALTKKPEPADNNIDTLEDEYFEAMIAGDKARAKEIRATINTEIFNRAQVASAETAAATLSQREMQTSFTSAVEQTVKAYPFLDSTKPEANAEAIAEVVEWRDFFISKGESPAMALQKAAGKVAPLYAAKADPTPPPVDTRKQKAVEVAAKTASAQPPSVEAGVGNRSIPLGDDLINDQNKWDKASEAERQRFLA